MFVKKKEKVLKLPRPPRSRFRYADVYETESLRAFGFLNALGESLPDIMQVSGASANGKPNGKVMYPHEVISKFEKRILKNFDHDYKKAILDHKDLLRYNRKIELLKHTVERSISIPELPEPAPEPSKAVAVVGETLPAAADKGE